MTYEERYEDQFLAQCQKALRAMLRHLLALMDQTSLDALIWLPRASHSRLLAIIRPAELMARRMLLVMACSLTLPPARPRILEKRSKSAAPTQKPLPGFKITEPWPSTTPYSQRKPFARPAPRIWAWDQDGFLIGAPPPQDPEPIPDGARLIARMKALESVIAEPERYARRMARWFIRPTSARRPWPLAIQLPRINKRGDWYDNITNAQHFAKFETSTRQIAIGFAGM